MSEEDVALLLVLAAGLSDQEILRLAAVRRHIRAGALDELTMEYKRKVFAQHYWNYTHQEANRVEVTDDEPVAYG